MLTKKALVVQPTDWAKAERGVADRGWVPLTYPLSIDFAPLIAADGNTKSLVI